MSTYPKDLIRDLIDGNVKRPIERLHFFPNLANATAGPTKRETCIVTFFKDK